MSIPADVPPGTWEPARRAAQAIVSPIQRILAEEATSGLLLLTATVVALVWANCWHASYTALWQLPLGVTLGDWSFVRPLHFWINDGLMTVFFFVVGLEIRREIYEGELADVSRATLPLAAALGGMLVPAAIYATLNAGRAGAAGWAIPMATDIAFAVGALTLLGSRVPGTLRILLLSLAVIDDIGAIIVIALVFNTGFEPSGLLIVGLGMAAVLALRSAAMRSPLVYALPGIAIWAGLYYAGVHPTLAGVLLGLLTPVRPWFGPSGFATTTQSHLEVIGQTSLDRSEVLARLDEIEHARREAVSPTERLIHGLHPWVAFGIMPVFALANAGVEFGGAALAGDAVWMFAGIVAGLAVGKPLGIVGAAFGASATPLATRSADASLRGVVLVGLVGGIGFTMSLFIAQLAFPSGPMLETAKLAILVGSATAMVVGLGFGFATRSRGERA